MSIFKNRSTRILIFVMIILVFIGLIISHFHYKSVNKSKDPRTIEANELYDRYNKLAPQNDFNSLLTLLDSIETIYLRYPHYRNSYELGVIYNNRTAIYLTIAMFKDSLRKEFIHPALLNLGKDTLLQIAESHVRESIAIYEDWYKRFDQFEDVALKQNIYDEFMTGLDEYSDDDKERFLESRIKELQNARVENSRRLSVSYTNLGIIYRNRKEYKKAIQYYEKALDLWDRNLTAENNINILLGRPLKKRNFIQKLFPPDRIK